MKNFKTYYVVAALAIGFVSCKKEDKQNDEDKIIKSRIIGTWTLQKTETKDYTNDTLKYSNTEIETNVNTIEFKADGTIKTFGDNSIKSGTYTITNSGKSLNLNIGGELFINHEIRAILPNDLVLYREDINTTDGVTRKFTSLQTYRR